ncbi:hypothetical protein GEMRC1_011663 [Eukaryota sp. GEM-RC1]
MTILYASQNDVDNTDLSVPKTSPADSYDESVKPVSSPSNADVPAAMSSTYNNDIEHYSYQSLGDGCSPYRCRTCAHNNNCFRQAQVFSHQYPIVPQVMPFPALNGMDPNNVVYVMPHQMSPVPIPIYQGHSYGYHLVPAPPSSGYYSAASRFMPASGQPANNSNRRRGRPPKEIPLETLKALVDQGKTQDEILAALREQGVSISSSTLKRRLARARLSTRVAIRKETLDDLPSGVFPTSSTLSSTTSSSLFNPMSAPVTVSHKQQFTDHYPFEKVEDPCVSLNTIGDEDKISTSFDDISLAGFGNDFY